MHERYTEQGIPLKKKQKKKKSAISHNLITL